MEQNTISVTRLELLSSEKLVLQEKNRLKFTSASVSLITFVNWEPCLTEKKYIVEKDVERFPTWETLWLSYFHLNITKSTCQKLSNNIRYFHRALNRTIHMTKKTLLLPLRKVNSSDNENASVNNWSRLSTILIFCTKWFLTKCSCPLGSFPW